MRFMSRVIFVIANKYYFEFAKVWKHIQKLVINLNEEKDQKLIKNKCFKKRLIRERVQKQQRIRWKKKQRKTLFLFIFEHVMLVETFIFSQMRPKIFFSITWNGFLNVKR